MCLQLAPRFSLGDLAVGQDRELAKGVWGTGNGSNYNFCGVGGAESSREFPVAWETQVSLHP